MQVEKKKCKYETLNEIWKISLPTRRSEYITLTLISAFLFSVSFYSVMLGFVYKEPIFLCKMKDSTYSKCTENEACSPENIKTYKIQPDPFTSFVDDFSLFCEKKQLRNLLFTSNLLVSSLGCFGVGILADWVGRKWSFWLSCFIPLIGFICGFLSEKLPIIALANILQYGFQNVGFTLVFIYTNEIFLDPIRSQSPGIQAMIFSVGQVGKILQKKF